MQVSTTLYDVARLAGVSIKTVSNVMNDFEHVKDSTRERVLNVVKQLGYQPNLSARSLRSGRSGVVGLVVPELTMPYFAEFADVLIAAAAAEGYSAVIEQTNRNRAREIEAFTGPRLQQIDGLLISPLLLEPEDIGLVDQGLPLVVLGETAFTPPVDHVAINNRRAARVATEHLLSTGRHRIALIGAHDTEPGGEANLRLRGYRDALEDAGVPFDESLIGYSKIAHRSNGADVMLAMVQSGVEFDAVFAVNDTLALGAIRALQDEGIRVPEDIAVMGFDNTDEGKYSSPSLTTIDSGRPEIARTAIRLLIERMRDSAPPVRGRNIEAGFSLIPRESTALPPGGGDSAPSRQ